MVAEIQSVLNQKRGEFMGVRSVEDIWFTDFSLHRGLLWKQALASKIMVAARSVGCTVNTQAQTHAQIHIHTQVPAYVQLPVLFQPCVLLQPSAHLCHN